jgi:hypothetical protein
MLVVPQHRYFFFSTQFSIYPPAHERMKKNVYLRILLTKYHLSSGPESSGLVIDPEDF